MTKIVIIGAGSGFGSRLSVDIMSRVPLQDATIALCDIHPGRLAQVTSYVQRTAEKYDLPTKVIASTDRRELLPDADFVIHYENFSHAAGSPVSIVLRLGQSAILAAFGQLRK